MTKPIAQARVEGDFRAGTRLQAYGRAYTMDTRDRRYFVSISHRGEAGAALAKAQDEWAESLRAFNDVAADHATLGWLEASRGRSEEASKELETAIALDPSDARPHVYLGVVAARAGRYDEALKNFKTAKSLDPSYQNLDRLLEEASKRARKSY